MRKRSITLLIPVILLLLSVSASALSPAEPEMLYKNRKAVPVALSLDPSDYPSAGMPYEASESEKTDRKTFKICVNCKTNSVTVYKNDGNGNYDNAVMAMVCSVGRATPKGTYRTSDKYRWHELFGRSCGQYCTRITGNILFHSVPYSAMRSDSLKYEEYNKLGTSASMGCVRLQAADAQWIYENCASGTQVVIYSEDDPGPLGKPDYVPIDTASANRVWDPTDTDENNPWREVEAYTPLWAKDKPEIIGIEN